MRNEDWPGAADRSCCFDGQASLDKKLGRLGGCRASQSRQAREDDRRWSVLAAASRPELALRFEASLGRGEIALYGLAASDVARLIVPENWQEVEERGNLIYEGEAGAVRIGAVLSFDDMDTVITVYDLDA